MTDFVTAAAVAFQLVSAVPTATATGTPPGAVEADSAHRISAQVFGDYYAFARHHLPAWEGQHGIWFRRVYVTYDRALTPTLSARLRLEMNSNGALEGGTLTPLLKDAYLHWAFAGRQTLTLGLQPTLTFNFVESVWGLRYVEKTPVDLYRLDSSRDTGLTMAGPLNADATMHYAAQFGNDSGTGSETNSGKTVRVAARYLRDHGVSVEGLYAYADRGRHASRTTAQIFGAWHGPRARIGSQYTRQTQQQISEPDGHLDLWSGFIVVALVPETWSAFARIDHYAQACEACDGIDYLPIAPTHPFTMALAGLEYVPHPVVRISPNVEWVSYQSRAGSVTTPPRDLVARATFSWSW